MTAHGRSRRPRPVRRFLVADRSMEPTLIHGQGLIAVRGLPARPGQIRCALHPDGSRWLVKRVASVDGDRLTLASDNPEHAVDSRHFGTVAVRGTYTVLIRIPLRLM